MIESESIVEAGSKFCAFCSSGGSVESTTPGSLDLAGAAPVASGEAATTGSTPAG
ncbi:MAG: hypothetical protein NTV34_19395 [Proteobacteria bacterium]|nr:hypothetical protein [Pseudomonadota bacterium]